MYLPTTADLDLLLRVDDATGRTCASRSDRAEALRSAVAVNEFIESFLVQEEGHFVNGVRHVARFDDRVRANVAKHGKLLPDIGIERTLSAANQDLWLETDLAQLRDTLLEWAWFSDSPAARM